MRGGGRSPQVTACSEASVITSHMAPNSAMSDAPTRLGHRADHADGGPAELTGFGDPLGPLAPAPLQMSEQNRRLRPVERITAPGASGPDDAASL